MDEINTTQTQTQTQIQIQNQFDRIPDDIVRLILNRVQDAKSLCACLAISKRFNSLVPETNNISLHVDRIHFTDKDEYQNDDDDDEEQHQASNSSKHSLLHSLVKLFITAPIRFLAKTLSRAAAAARSADSDQICNSNSEFYSPSEALKSFSEIECLRIQLPSLGELQLDQANNNPLLKWNATFGSQLKTCVIIAGTSIESKTEIEDEQGEKYSDSVSESFLDCEATKVSKSEDERIVDQRVDRSDLARPLISNEDLKQRVIWTISCLIAASSRHHLLKRIVAEQPALKSIEIVDEEQQGTLTMNESEIAEMRRSMESSNPAESGVDRTRVPAVRMNMWCREEVELRESGKVMKAATLVMIGAAAAASGGGDVEVDGGEFVAGVDQKIYREAAREMGKMERSYSLEIESF